MALFAIGDIQGCLDPLQRLLERIRFDPLQDWLWLTGDLVNRGPDSLAVLRFVKNLGDRATTVLGNHDLHLLAVASGTESVKTSDTLDEVLHAPDRDELLAWLRGRPLLHLDRQIGFALLHAGLPPQWDVWEAKGYAAEVEAALRGPNHAELFRHMYGNHPTCWEPTLSGWDRLRFIINCLTRLRFCSPHGQLALTCKGPPGTQPPGFRPWFDIPGRRSRGWNVVFGHWAALGLHRAEGVYALDSGCVWGGTLTAVHLDDPTNHQQVSCARPPRRTSP